YDPEEAIRAYARAGGIFSDKKNKFGETVAMMVGFKSAKVIEAFAESGGIFEETPDELADRAYMSRRGMLDPEHLEAYTKAYNAQKRAGQRRTFARGMQPDVPNP
ncbi:MAG: hypothetical protein PHE27_02535, partial [Alphaproteobacteria bacterium]|nr:hypothetical protein [Alphaproteobacteria bacterium]